MIAVPVSVEHVAQLSFPQLLERGANLVRERRELVIDYKNPIGSDRDADVSASVDGPGPLRDGHRIGGLNPGGVRQHQGVIHAA